VDVTIHHSAGQQKQHDAGIVANLGALDSWLMIHPITQAAFAIYSNRGAYAFILGSGVSRGSQIKTGYEIVLDLADQIARLSDEDTAGDPEAWYRAKFNEDLDYSRVLERVGNTAAERQSILRHYFEPSPEERQRGEMLPTEAHRAIGALVEAGYVKVIHHDELRSAVGGRDRRSWCAAVCRSRSARYRRDGARWPDAVSSCQGSR